MKLYIVTEISYISRSIEYQKSFEKLEDAQKAMDEREETCNRILAENWYKVERETGRYWKDGILCDLYNEDLEYEITLRSVEVETKMEEKMNEIQEKYEELADEYDDLIVSIKDMKLFAKREDRINVEDILDYIKT